MPDKSNWIITGSLENFQTTRKHGFTIQGLKSRHRKAAERIRPGDRLAWYVTGVKAFGATATVTSEYYEDHTPVWITTDPKKKADIYPFRFKIKGDVILDESEFVDAEPVARQLNHVAKWPPANWTLAFQGNIRAVDDHDFEILEDALKSAAKAVTTGD